MKNSKLRISLLLAICLLVASLVTVLIASAEDGAESVTVSYANGTSATYAEGETIEPIAVPKDFARYDEAGDAYVYTVTEGAEWTFVLDGKALTELTVTKAMLGKTVYADVAGTMGDAKVYYTIHENIKDTTVPEEMRGEFLIYGYDTDSLITYLSRSNAEVVEGTDEPRYRYLRQRDNVFHIKMYADMYPVAFDPKWGDDAKDWAAPNRDGGTTLVQDRTWRGTFTSSGAANTGGESARVYFDMNGHLLEVGSSESMHFGSMACTPYSMRLFIYSTTAGAVFSAAKSYAAFYADDDSRIYVGELDGSSVKYGKNLTVHAKMVTHLNYGSGVYLYGGRYYQVGANPDFLNISHRLYAAKNCEFYLADQSEALLFFNNGYKYNWSTTKSGMKFENCSFYVNQHGTAMIREVSSQDNKTHAEKPPVAIDDKYTLEFMNCRFYGIPTPLTSNYIKFKYTGDTVFSVGSSENWGTESEPLYLSYLAEPLSTETLTDINGQPVVVEEICALLSPKATACVQYNGEKSYWQPGATPFVFDNVVMTDLERYVESEGRYLGLPAVLEAGKAYLATGVKYHKKQVVAFLYTMDNGTEGYGLTGDTPYETGKNFAAKVGNLQDVSITLLADITLSGNVDFGTKGKVLLDMNGYNITVAADATPMGALHRVGDAMTVRFYSSRPGSVYENLSSAPIFSLSHSGKGGKIYIGDYEYKTGATYSGENITYISRGSLFYGYPKNEGVTAESTFEAKNIAFVYTGEGAAIVTANTVKLSYCRVTMDPANKEATPVAVAARADVDTLASFSSVSFYATGGVEASLITCVNEKGEIVNKATKDCRVSFSNVALCNVAAAYQSPAEGLTVNYAQISFADLLDLSTFYGDELPTGQALLRTSEEIYENGSVRRVALWVSAPASDRATVRFDATRIGLGVVSEDWLIGSITCRDSIVVDDLFVFGFGERVVPKEGIKIQIGCRKIVSGTMRISFTLTGAPTLNLLVPMNTPLLSVTVDSTKYDITPKLDYMDDFYVISVPLTDRMLLGEISLALETAARTETLKLRPENYIRSLMVDDEASAEEKHLVYAILERAEMAQNSSLGITSPSGYQERDVAASVPPELPTGMASVAFDIKDGLALVIRGAAGKAVSLVSTRGEAFEGVIGADGVYRFEGLPLQTFHGTFTLTYDGTSFDYSVSAYKGSSDGAEVQGDMLYMLFYYADAMYPAAEE